MRFRLGQARIDLGAHLVECGERSTTLTPIESALLQRLLEAEEAPVPRDVLLQEVWGYSSAVKTRTLTVTVHRLRTKIESDPGTPQHLITVRGAGVQLRGVMAESSTSTPASSTLVGRDEAIATARSRWSPERGLLTFCGPVGVGKTAIAAAVAPPGALWVDADGAKNPEVVLARMVRQGPERGETTLEAATRILQRHNGLVLDGLEPDVFDSELSQLAQCTGVIVTSRGPRSLKTEQVVRLAPLEMEDRKALLQLELSRQGFSVAPEILREVAGQLDGLPLEIIVVAPLVGLFGVDAVQGVAESLRPMLQSSLERLDPDAQVVLHDLAAFHEGFDLLAAMAVTGTTRLVAASMLQLLHRRGLLTRSGHTFRLLRSLRTLLENQVTDEAAEALVAYCAGLTETSFEDDGARLALHAADLEWACSSPGEHTSSLARGLLDSAYLVGPIVRYLRSLEKLANTGNRDAEHLAWIVRGRAGGSLTAAQLSTLGERADSGDGLAAVAGYSAEVATMNSGRSLRAWLDAVHPLEMAYRVRCFPTIFAFSLDPEAERVLSEILTHCRQKGWVVTEHYVRDALSTCWAVQGRPELAIREPIYAESVMVCRRGHLNHAMAAILMGNSELAVQHARQAAEAYPPGLLEPRLMEAMGTMLAGGSVDAILDDLDPGAVTTMEYAVWLVLRTWPEPPRVEHPSVQALVETGEFREHALPGRVMTSLRSTLTQIS